MYIGEYERRKKLKLIQQDKDKTGLTKVVVALQDQMMENDDKRKWKMENGKMKNGEWWERMNERYQMLKKCFINQPRLSKFSKTSDLVNQFLLLSNP